MRKAWLIAWREIRWEIFGDRSSVLRSLFFVALPLALILANRGVTGARADSVIFTFGIQSALIPAVTGVALIASTFSQEKENGTLVPLLAAPIRDFDIVLGKLIGMVIPVMGICAATMLAFYLLASAQFSFERVFRVLPPEMVYAILVIAFLYLITTGSIVMITTARVRTSRGAQQTAGLIITLSFAVFVGLGFLSTQLGDGWALLGLGAALVAADVVFLEIARRVWQRGEVIGRI